VKSSKDDDEDGENDKESQEKGGLIRACQPCCTQCTPCTSVFLFLHLFVSESFFSSLLFFENQQSATDLRSSQSKTNGRLWKGAKIEKGQLIRPCI
jgi:hypothetical protein